MAGKAHEAATVYEEFEPLCKWQRKEDRDILEIHLQEFKKEQLKVQISNHGVLKISGERPLDALTKTKFHKEIPVPSNKYDNQSIHAKFVNGYLYITMPKHTENGKNSSEPSKIDDQIPKPDFPKDQSTGPPPPPSSQDNVTGGAKEQTAATLGGNATTEFEFRGRRGSKSGSRLAKVAVSLAATAAAVAVLVAYVVYMYRSTVDEFDD
ncbi:hypothetical protein DH2020_039666 [Rehmannia glutinosa]|uniref:SHSP domain-containing protein n=1 Tax=Rehmannia glutinosa TaxID=99300 RepID=A0ABR0UVQ5_REHGL